MGARRKNYNRKKTCSTRRRRSGWGRSHEKKINYETIVCKMNFTDDEPNLVYQTREDNNNTIFIIKEHIPQDQIFLDISHKGIIKIVELPGHITQLCCDDNRFFRFDIGV